MSHDARKAADPSPGAALLDLYSAQGREPAPHLKAALAALSREHCSGISPGQLDTPMMRQFRTAKEEFPDALLFFRMGDFYELFGLDAVIASDVCSLTLTSRDKGSDNPVPMCGVPAVAYRAALRKCVQAGYKVAVCDQMEDPRLAKGLVKREITRVATPAVPGDLGDEEPDSAQGCYLACALGRGDARTLAFVDVSTAEFRVSAGLSREALEEELLTLKPREILCASEAVTDMVAFARGRFPNVPRVASVEPWVLRSEKDARALFEEFFAASDFNRFGLGAVEQGLPVVAGILAYLKTTQKSVLRNLRNIAVYQKSEHLLLDDSTKKHLDFFATATGDRKGSLYWFLNRCATAPGARALVRRMNYPFKDAATIEAHLACVEEFLAAPLLEGEVGSILQGTADLDRLLARTAQGGIDPKGFAWLQRTLGAIPRLGEVLRDGGAGALLGRLSRYEGPVGELGDLFLYLEGALEDEPAAVLGKGRVFRTGFSPELDEVVALETDFDGLMAALEAKEREKTGIGSLKIGYTRVFGYYFEISKGKLSQVPSHFLRKQTLTNGERFITQELKELEEKALVATERRAVLERELFEAIRARVIEYADALAAASAYLAEIDLARTFALLARQYGWCKPCLSDVNETVLEGSSHPILASLAGGDDPFVANDVRVGEGHGAVLLITGPNMAGKSTIMRQIALAQVLAQMGCYVPARAARVGPCDRVFTRIGSGDFALRAQSTFMVEMLETAHILRNATPASLVLMDEIGRGTSTFDGLSLAWAILEDLHDRVGARTLFSTHYHEILEVASGRPGIVPMQMEVIEQERREPGGAHRWEIFFSRRFREGSAGKSYGLHVAEMAGLSVPLLGRAGEVLARLGESGGVRASGARSGEVGNADAGVDASCPPRISLEAIVAAAAATAAPTEPPAHSQPESELLAALAAIDPDELSPREALDALFELRAAAGLDGEDAAARYVRKKRRGGAKAAQGETLF